MNTQTLYPIQSPGMEFYQLHSFVTVARTGNVTRAALELNTTPPAVSNHIRQLEENLGIVLFTRTSKGMQLTSEGRKMKEKAFDILMAANEMQTLAKNLQQEIQGHVTLGINADPGFLKIPDLIKDLYHDSPGIRLQIITSSSGEIQKQIDTGHLDCGFVFGKPMPLRIETVGLCPVDLEIAIPFAFKEHLKNSSLDSLAALPWIFPTHYCPFLGTVRDYLMTKGIELKNRVFANDDITKGAFIEQGAAVSVLEKSEAKGYEKQGKIFLWQGKKTFSTTLSFAYSRQKADDRLIRTVTESLLKIWKTG